MFSLKRLVHCFLALSRITGLVESSLARAERLNVKVVNRQSSDTDYSYQVAGQSNAFGSDNINCYSGSGTTSCQGNTKTTAYTTAPRLITYYVTGATLSLQLPDGRVAVVNCVSKFQERFAGSSGNHRSCREPIVDSIVVEFKGKNAKLFWPVSIDGKKEESETYKILGILAD